MKIAIIGGGAAGFFAAVNIKEFNPQADVTIFERNSQPLKKVALTGGGRCNLTNSFENVNNLARVYPRCENLIKRAFSVFNYKDTFEWFENHGIKLTVQDDCCVFPKSQNAMEIVDMFLSYAEKYNVKIKSEMRVCDISKHDDEFVIKFKDVDFAAHADKVIFAAGGYPHTDVLKGILKNLPVDVVECVPSLFGMVIENEKLRALQGCVVDNVTVLVPSTKFKASDALLITHWGMSGPAILKLSSYASRYLSENDYKAKLSVNWCGKSFDEAVYDIVDFQKFNLKKQISTYRFYNLTTRMRNYLIERAGIDSTKPWSEISKKNINKLVTVLTGDEYDISGKNNFKEEFVTSGGVSLKCLNYNTMELKECQGIYFVGEAADIDAVTGGFNLQAAWSTAYVAARAVCDIK